MTVLNLDVDQAQIAAFCRKWRIKEMSLFGSVLRDDFRPDSDVDVLVTFENDAQRSLWEFLEAQAELDELLGRKVDLVEKKNVVNPFVRHHILKHRHVIYDARS